jgi:hypothetical protein
MVECSEEKLRSASLRAATFDRESALADQRQ